MRINMLEEVKVMLEDEQKRIVFVYHPIEQKYYVKKEIHAPWNAEVYRMLKKYPHPGFAKVYEVEIVKDTLIVIEEFINGVTLEYALSEGSLEYSKAISYIAQLLQTLRYLHSLNPPIIHRDLKPANIMIDNDKLKLIDFDIARHFDEEQAKDTVIMGSVGYAAPEQYGFLQSDPRTDIYAVGVLINEIFTGKHPHDELVLGRLTKIVKKCIYMDPKQRYKNVESLYKAFKNATSYRASKPHVSSKKYTWKIIYFFFTFLFCMSALIDNTPERLMVDRISNFSLTLFMFLLPPLIASNTWGLKEITPLSHSRFLILRVLNGVLTWLGILFLFVIAYSLILSILEIMLQA